MPARVHAILVVRPDGRTPAAHHLRRTLAGLGEQTRRVDALTIVVCGDDAGVAAVAAASGAESVITAPASTGFAAATAMATLRVTGDAVWILAQDTAPEPEALARLAGALERAPSVAFVAPKLVRWDDRTEIVSLGVSMTAFGRTVGLADAELDQGQHDAREDVLGADIRGILVRTDAWRELGGIDRALVGADEGLDLGVRARLAGARVLLAPTALVAVSGDGVAGLPSTLTGQRRRRRAYRVARRAAAPSPRLRAAARRAVPVARDPSDGALAHRPADRAQAPRTRAARVARRRRRHDAAAVDRARTLPHPCDAHDRLAPIGRRCASRSARSASSSTTTPTRRRPRAAKSSGSSRAVARGWCSGPSSSRSPRSPRWPPGPCWAAAGCSRSAPDSRSCGPKRPTAFARRASTRSGRPTRSRRSSRSSAARGRPSRRVRS